MPLPWKKSKSGRISRFVTDLQHSPKHGGSLFVETGFPTSLIDLFVKNRDRLKKSSSKRNNNKAPTQTAPTRPRVLSPPLLQRLDPASVTEDLTASKVDEDLDGGSCLTSENRHDGDDNKDHRNGGDRGGGCCVLTVVVVKVFAVAVLALSTKKLAVGITISAFALILLELAVVRVFTLLNLCPDAEVRLHSLFGKLIGKKKRKEKVEESSSSSMQEREKNKVSLEIIESFQDSRDCVEEVQVPPEEREVETIREVVLIKEKSKSAKLKSKIVKKIVPKKLRTYKKKKKLKMKEKQEAEGVKVAEEEKECLTEVSSFYSEDRIERGISERDETGSNPPFLESCEEVEEEEEEESGSKGDLTKVIVLVVIALAGLLIGKVIASVLTLSWCLILRFVCCKSQTSL
ncbi:hypothetical protein Bca4012_055333 [Brassica carinata]|uniref:Ethylene-responsive nuclear protein n=1 Tax=Brassica carinata TaxID=52824 RepID=A0A8X7VV39_BRACI|nr:hypothetical protein Bca52824_011677 [Brassica carinata]